MSKKRFLDDKSVHDKEMSLWFWGDGQELDDLLVNYLKTCKNSKNGVVLSQLENYFIYRRQLCSEKQLTNHLASLQKFKIVRFDVYRGLKFYRVVK